MKEHRRHVRSRFSAAACTYTESSSLQDRVARRVLELVPAGFDAARILDAGCGPGRLAALARARWPDAFIVGVDIAPGMIREARGRLAGDPRMSFEERDIAAYCPDAPCDLLLSSSALQWLKPFDAGLAHVAGLVRPGGLLALGVMLDGTLAELHASRRAAAPHKPVAGRLPTLAEFEKAVRAIPGARVRRIESAAAEYDQPSGADVLRAVHEMGVTGGDVSRGPAPLTRADMKALAAHYDGHFASDGGVRVTFVMGYALVECGADKG